MGDEKDLRLFGMVFAPSGNDRLNLYYIAVTNTGGFDFHSVVWESRNRELWNKQVEITREQFQGTHKRRRWVSELGSLSPGQASALIKVAEGDREEGVHSIQIGYSWRQWDLRKNAEIEKLRDCDPFDPP